MKGGGGGRIGGERLGQWHRAGPAGNSGARMTLCNCPELGQDALAFTLLQ